MENVYFHGNRHKKEIALTFDDGPSADTKKILKILKKEKIPATFFICGKKIQKNKVLIKKMINQGCEIGNHTYSHRLLLFKNKKIILKEISDTDKALAEIGVKTSLMRPPYFWIGLFGILSLKKLNKKIIECDVIPRDWKRNKERQRADKIIKKTRNGSIIVLHDYLEKDIGPNPLSIKITKRIIGPLKKKGFQFKKVSEIIK